MKQNESVKELEVGKDYVNKYGVVVVDRSGDYGNIGFEDGDYEHDLFCRTPENWREATESEVIEAFEKHLIHRYGEDWKTMKIKERHPYLSGGLNSGTWCIDISKDVDGWNVCNKNGLLYSNGIWVERLENKELEKIHIKDAIKERTVIHCATEEEAERILGMAHTLGYKWWIGKNYDNDTEWSIYKNSMCYDLFEGSYSHYDYFNSENYTIIHSTQIADLEKKKSTDWTPAPEDIEEMKKRYEVIKTTFSDFKQLSLGDNKTNKIIAHFVEQDEETALLAEKIVDILNLIEK